LIKKAKEVSVDPSILKWARKSIGMNIKEVADKLDIEEEVVKSWESGHQSPTLYQLKKLASYYKRPLAVFFLPEPPEEPSYPTDFRTLPDGEELPLSQDTRLAIRKAWRIQNLTEELKGKFEEEITNYMGNVELSSDPEQVSKKLREWIDVTIEEQLEWKDTSGALDNWINALENIGLIVTQNSMPIEEVRAFSVKSNKIPIITLNTKDSMKGRIFSLFHELGHILLDIEGLCMPFTSLEWENHDKEGSQIEEIEIFCNHLSGAFLAPKDALLELKTVKRNESKEWSEHRLGRISNQFKVSKEVILRRLLIFGKTDKEFYQKKREEWRKKAKEKRMKGGSGYREVPRECIRENSKYFISTVLDSYKNNEITYSDVADYLDVKLKHIPEVEELVEGG